MKEIFIGTLIKKRRIELGISQEQLCEGICEPMTISRLENGHQLPSRHRLQAILDRLGLPSDRYFAILTKDDANIVQLQSDINALVCQAEWEVGNAIHEKIEQAREKMSQLENLFKKEDPLIKQFIMSVDLTLKKLEGHVNFDDQLALALDTIKLTVPKIDLTKINQSILSLDEITILNQIATIYSAMDLHKESIEIYAQLSDYIQEHFINHVYSASSLALIEHNYARELDITKDYQHAVSVSEIGIRACIDYGHYQFLPGLYHIQAESWHYLGDDAKSRDLFYQTYYLYKAIDNSKGIQLLQIDADICFNNSLKFN